MIDPHGPSMMPVNDRIAALVTAMHSSNIESTMCNGKWLMKERKILTLDEEAILKEAQERSEAGGHRTAGSFPGDLLELYTQMKQVSEKRRTNIQWIKNYWRQQADRPRRI